jgi:hydrogenase maturation factor
MIVVVSAGKADAVLKAIRAAKHDAWFIGEVVKGTGEASVV